jgi:hypothetical protein
LISAEDRFGRDDRRSGKSDGGPKAEEGAGTIEGVAAADDDDDDDEDDDDAVATDEGFFLCDT